MPRRSLLPLLAGIFLLAAGCADPVVFSEIFQQQEGQKIYTAYNIWYTDPDAISCLNIQQGSFIPIGTEIIPEETTSAPFGLGFYERIRFRDTAGREYTIRFDSGYRLTSMRDYIGYTFTTTPPEELLKDVPEQNRLRISRGEVVPGMNRREVTFAYGPPPLCRTPDLRNESWIYWLTQTETVRVVFRGDIVRNIFNINNQ